MLVTFRIIDTETRLHSTPAILNARELAALCQLLSDNSLMPDLDNGETEGSAYHFEVAANGLALATFARVLSFRTDVIAVVEEAQFLGRTLRIERSESQFDTLLRVSNHIALTPDLMMAEDLANKALSALGLAPDRRTIRISKLQELLQKPSTSKAFDDQRIGTIFDALARVAFVDCGEQIPHLEWA